MNNELIERIDSSLDGSSDESGIDILEDCKAEIARLLLANETLKELNVEYLERVKALEVKPSTDALIAQAIEDYIAKVTVIKSVNLRTQAQPYLDELIAEIDGLQKVDLDDFGAPYPSTDGDFLYSKDIRVALDKYRGAK